MKRQVTVDVDLDPESEAVQEITKLTKKVKSLETKLKKRDSDLERVKFSLKQVERSLYDANQIKEAILDVFTMIQDSKESSNNW